MTVKLISPAAFSPRESGEGIQRLLYERHWVPAFARTTKDGANASSLVTSDAYHLLPVAAAILCRCRPFSRRRALPRAGALSGRGAAFRRRWPGASLPGPNGG